MERTKVLLKNDQNNHLNDQIEQFDSFPPMAKKTNIELFNSLYEAFYTDDVTPTYIRGYN